MTARALRRRPVRSERPRVLNQGKLSEGQAEELLGIVENLQTILDFDFSQVSGEMEETGANISAGIAQGFTQYGWETMRRPSRPA